MQDEGKKSRSILYALRSNAYNIQTLLRQTQDGLMTPEVLEKITHVIENHFDRVESLDIEISQKNKQEHQEILKQFKSMHKDWKRDILSDSDYAELLRCRLFNHFSTCFQPILDTHLGDDVKTEFRL
jgi:hemerythrin